MSEEQATPEEVDAFEWDYEMEFYFNILSVGCSGLDAVESINEMTKKDKARKEDITDKCVNMIKRSVDYFDKLLKEVEEE